MTTNLWLDLRQFLTHWCIMWLRENWRMFYFSTHAWNRMTFLRTRDLNAPTKWRVLHLAFSTQCVHLQFDYSQLLNRNFSYLNVLLCRISGIFLLSKTRSLLFLEKRNRFNAKVEKTQIHMRKFEIISMISIISINIKIWDHKYGV